MIESTPSADARVGVTRLSGHISRDRWRRLFPKADITDSIAVARHACQDAGELELVGICSGAWYAAQAARNIGARSAILGEPAGVELTSPPPCWSSGAFGRKR